MKQLLVGGLLTAGFCLLATTGALARDIITDSDSFVDRATNFRSGVSVTGSGTTPPLTPFLFVDSFNSSLGTLTSVKITYTLTSEFNLSLRNNAASADTVRLVATSNLSAFLVEGGNVGGEFVDPAFDAPDSQAELVAGSFGVTARSPQSGSELFTLQGGETRSFVRTVTASRIQTFTADSNPDVISFFNRDGSQIRVGSEGRAFTTLSAGGNFTATQVTTDDGTFAVEYTFQPVPAPPAAISLGIGGLVGLIGTGAKRIRRRSKC